MSSQRGGLACTLGTSNRDHHVPPRARGHQPPIRAGCAGFKAGARAQGLAVTVNWPLITVCLLAPHFSFVPRLTRRPMRGAWYFNSFSRCTQQQCAVLPNPREPTTFPAAAAPCALRFFARRHAVRVD